MNAEPTIATPPAPSELAFPDAHSLRSRDVFRLVARVLPFIRPYRRHLVYLFLLTLPALLGGLVGLTLMRVFFDVVGHGAALKPGLSLADQGVTDGTRLWLRFVPRFRR